MSFPTETPSDNQHTQTISTPCHSATKSLQHLMAGRQPQTAQNCCKPGTFTTKTIRLALCRSPYAGITHIASETQG